LNGFLALACIGVAVIQLAIPYVPPLADAFRATPLNLVDLAFVAAIAIVPAVVADLVRIHRRVVWVA
jgi:hypothetical protein